MKKSLKYFALVTSLMLFSSCTPLKKNVNIDSSIKDNDKKDVTLQVNNKTVKSEKESNNKEPANENKLKNNDNIKNSTEKSSDKSENIPKENIDISKLATKERDWFFSPKKSGIPSEVPDEINKLIKPYNGYFLGDTTKKEIFLTFDEGYENGYTEKILDILKNNNVKAAFFVTLPYIKENKELINRMVKEGHFVYNHSSTHPSMAKIKDINKFKKELEDVEVLFKDVTGTEIKKFFRPPMGKYSELSLYYTSKLGYKTIFWSSAYSDWDPKKQPTLEYGKKIILERSHNGGIILLHAVSKTNTEILDYLIKEWKTRGYELKTLDYLK